MSSTGESGAISSTRTRPARIAKRRSGGSFSRMSTWPGAKLCSLAPARSRSRCSALSCRKIGTVARRFARRARLSPTLAAGSPRGATRSTGSKTINVRASHARTRVRSIGGLKGFDR